MKRKMIIAAATAAIALSGMAFGAGCPAGKHPEFNEDNTTTCAPNPSAKSCTDRGMVLSSSVGACVPKDETKQPIKKHSVSENSIQTATSENTKTETDPAHGE